MSKLSTLQPATL